MVNNLEADRNHILVFRFSALGDVAMTVPVIRHWLEQHPLLNITVVSTQFTAPLFSNIPRCRFIAADLKGRHSGILGLYRLYKEIQKQTGKTLVADLHQVLRTAVLKFFFRFSGFTIATIDKGRDEKRRLTSRHKRRNQILKSQHERYADVFRSLGFPGDLDAAHFTPNETYPDHPSQLSFSKDKLNIGVAPFAKHEGKCYPLDQMKQVLHRLEKSRYRIFLFGGGANEIKILRSWLPDLEPDAVLVAGNFSFEYELKIISKLDMMVSMDSANMHLASLFAVPVVSIWGATHPNAGFMGFGQTRENVVSLELDCSPCSVFGNKKCWRGDFACMKQLSSEQVYLAISRCASNIRS